jgi:hypothetical protein
MYFICWIVDFISHVSHASLWKLSESKPFANMFEYGILFVCDHPPRNLGVECMMSTSCHPALNFWDVGWWPHSNVCCDWSESRCNLWKVDTHHDSIFAKLQNLHFVPCIEQVWSRKSNWRCKIENQNVVFASIDSLFFNIWIKSRDSMFYKI